MNLLKDQHVLILGLGVSGLAMARWCARCGARVTVADTRDAPPSLDALRAEVPSANFIAGPFTPALIDGTDVRAVFVSPGLAPAATAPVTGAARAVGLWTGGELDLFARALADLKDSRGYAPKVLAITGTNGKTTVTSLCGVLLERAGKRVAVAGNIGPALLDTLALQLAALPEADAAAEIEVARAIEEAAREAAEAKEKAEAAARVAESARKAAVKAGVEDLLADESVDEPGEEPADEPLEDSLDEPAEEEDDASSGLQADADSSAAPAEAATPETSAVASPVLALGNRVLPEVWVLELSSFQLDGVQGFEPTAAVVLNLTQDHLDWHGDMAAYGAAKQRVFGTRGLMLLNREDAAVAGMRPAIVKAPRGEKAFNREVATFGTDMPTRPGDWGLETTGGMTWLVRAMEADETRKRGRRPSAAKALSQAASAEIYTDEDELHIQRLMPADALRIRGRHNAANALAALALTTTTGAALGPMLYGLRDYRGEPHRMEPVGLVDGIEYFDDSKGTNVGATVAALQGLGAERRVVVIQGGEGKGQDFSPLAEPVRRFARAVVLIGRDAPLIRAALEGTGVQMTDEADMHAAVMRATERAQGGDAVLLSPACASFDMFDNYSHRGRMFRDAVTQIAADAGVMLELAE